MAAPEFFTIVTEVFAYPLQSVLTDNGSEFMKHFDEELRRLHKNHWHAYPKTPKMNAHVERFNRTLQDEFIDYHHDLLISPNQFNRNLSHGTTLNDLFGIWNSIHAAQFL